MPDTYKFVVSALYVTFSYACIAFGALIYRQIIDNANQRTISLGEEVYLLFDSRIAAGIGILFFFFCIFVTALVTKDDVLHEEVNRSAPGLLFFVVPMILLVNILQLYMRGRWQRTSVRTQGIVVRRLFSEQFFALNYQQLELIEVENEWLWFRLTFYLVGEEKAVCSCWVGKKAWERLRATIQHNSECIVELRSNT